MSTLRRLAAIMFTDIVGYTSMIQAHEEQAVNAVKRYQSVLAGSVVQHHGEVLNDYGDGSLTIFDSASDAVACAVELQLKLIQAPNVPLRLGLHIGEILIDDGIVFGESVNLASRLESIGTPGAVLLSRNVQEKIQNRPEYQVDTLGSFDFKGIEEAVQVYYLRNAGLAIPDSIDITGKLKEKDAERSIAVLPFVNVSQDTEQEYFCDGMCDELINALSQIDGLRVTARSSAFLFKNTQRDVRDIGKELGVHMILEGSIRKAGNRIRITANLVHAINRFQIWSGKYDRQLEDVFEIQDDISKAIVTALRVKLDLGATETIVGAKTENIDAYNLYLQARHLYNRRNAQDNARAIELLETAVASDHTFGLGYAMLALTYIEQFFTYQPGPVWEKKARAALEQAKIHAPHIPEIYVASGNLLWTRSNNFPHIAAIKEHRKALALNPNHADALNEVARILWHIGLVDEAAASLSRALEIDPGFIDGRFRLGWLEMHRGNFEDALTLLQEVPQGSFEEPVSGLRAKCLWYMGRRTEAFTLMHSLPASLLNDPEVASTMAIFAALEGRNDAVEPLVTKAVERGSALGHYHHVTHNIAQAYAVLNNVDEVLHWLKFTIDDGFPCYSWFSADPLLDNVRDDPRFKDLMADLAAQSEGFKALLSVI